MSGKILEINGIPDGALKTIKDVSAAASARGWRVYIVGGAVRDMLLGRMTNDIDLALEGDAIELAGALEKPAVKITTHPSFRTASIKFQDFKLDLATTREESYAHPGALPSLRSGTLLSDLKRRDFTVNAMAVSLNPDDYGRLIDPCGGEADLEDRIIRVLHKASFADDPTRIWRAVRYEQRLGFRIEPETQKLLKQDLAYLKDVSGDRIWHELECLLGEAQPEKPLLRLSELGVIARMHPRLIADSWLTGKFARARELYPQQMVRPAVYLALLTFRMSEKDSAEFAGRLNLSKKLSRALAEAQEIKNHTKALGSHGLKASAIYTILDGYSDEALSAASAAADIPEASLNISLFRETLRHVKPALNGDDLAALGIAIGPAITEMLDRLTAARLDGLVSTPEDEEKLVRALLAGGSAKSLS